MERKVYAVFLVWCAVLLAEGVVRAADPTDYLLWNVSYITANVLGVPQQVIAINGMFPGPVISTTTNHNLKINIINSLDEPFLLTWDGIQMRKNSWQDGVLGTNCPILPETNWTYQFQVKDQIGSFYYFPTTSFQKASGGFGGFVINNRATIQVPFPPPQDDFFVVIGDWYTAGHKALRAQLDGGTPLGYPDGIHINGKGPYGSVADFTTFTVLAGATYRLRVSNVGLATTLNFMIQGHLMLLVETEGSYTSMQNLTSLDVHVGQSYSVLVTMNSTVPADFYVVATPRFVNQSEWNATGVAVLHYAGSTVPASGEWPVEYDSSNSINQFWYAMNQLRSVTWNLTTGGARPNPQGSYRYGDIPINTTYQLYGSQTVMDGKTRYAVNGVSHQPPITPLKLADYMRISSVFITGSFPVAPAVDSTPVVGVSVIEGGYGSNIEMVFQNNDSAVNSWHFDGYSFFVLGFDQGVWTPDKRSQYNKWNAVARSTVQVLPFSWTAVQVQLNNPGMWNIRSQVLPKQYLGQELYIRIVDREEGASNGNETPAPDNLLYCGQLANLEPPAEPLDILFPPTRSMQACLRVSWGTLWLISGMLMAIALISQSL